MKKLILFLALSLALFAKTQTLIFGPGCFWDVEKSDYSFGMKRVEVLAKKSGVINE